MTKYAKISLILYIFQSVPKVGGGDDSNGMTKEEQKEQEQMR